LVCGKPGRDMFHASGKKLERMGVPLPYDRKTIGIDVTYVHAGYYIYNID